MVHDLQNMVNTSELETHTKRETERHRDMETPPPLTPVATAAQQHFHMSCSVYTFRGFVMRSSGVSSERIFFVLCLSWPFSADWEQRTS